MADQKITLTVSDSLFKKIESKAEEKFQTVDQFILDCVSARLQGGSSAIKAGGDLSDILTFSEFSEWLDNQYHYVPCRELAEIVKVFVQSGGAEPMPRPVTAKTR